MEKINNAEIKAKEAAKKEEVKAEVRATLFHRVITFLQHEKEAAPAATTDSAEPAAEAAPVSSEA